MRKASKFGTGSLSKGEDALWEERKGEVVNVGLGCGVCVLCGIREAQGFAPLRVFVFNEVDAQGMFEWVND